MFGVLYVDRCCTFSLEMVTRTCEVRRGLWSVTVRIGRPLETAVRGSCGYFGHSFGVAQHKVSKNWMTIETLYDYVDGKQSVGVICEDSRRATREGAEPIGAVLALLPTTSPASTAPMLAGAAPRRARRSTIAT
jgi:hypothetical protein